MLRDEVCDSFQVEEFTDKKSQMERLENNGFQKAVTEGKAIEYMANDKPSYMSQTIRRTFLENGNGKKYTLLAVSQKDNSDKFTTAILFLLDGEDFIDGSENNVLNDKFWD